MERTPGLLADRAFRGVATVLNKRIGRYTVAAVTGFGFGLVWGNHLSGHATVSKVLWSASLFLLGRPDRLLGFAVLNVAIASGIALAYGPAR